MSPLYSFALLMSVIGQVGGAPKLDEKQTVQLIEHHDQKLAERYEFYVDEARQQKMELVEQPVMRWTADGNLGAVWVWTRQGRAEVIGCLGAFRSGGKLEGFHEFHSLTLTPLQKVEIGTKYVWQSRGPGVVPKIMENAPDPAATAALRLIQMRNLAREFTAHMQAGQQSHELRLAPAPLFRFASTNPEVLDGALFSYLWGVGTDPEFLLLLEARKTPEEMRWHFSPVRFTWRSVRLTHNDHEVWRVEEHSESRTARLLRDSYVTCATGVLNLEELEREFKSTESK